MSTFGISHIFGDLGIFAIQNLAKSKFWDLENFCHSKFVQVQVFKFSSFQPSFQVWKLEILKFLHSVHSTTSLEPNLTNKFFWPKFDRKIFPIEFRSKKFLCQISGGKNLRSNFARKKNFGHLKFFLKFPDRTVNQWCAVTEPNLTLSTAHCTGHGAPHCTVPVENRFASSLLPTTGATYTGTGTGTGDTVLILTSGGGASAPLYWASVPRQPYQPRTAPCTAPTAHRASREALNRVRRESSPERIAVERGLEFPGPSQLKGAGADMFPSHCFYSTQNCHKYIIHNNVKGKLSKGSCMNGTVHIFVF